MVAFYLMMIAIVVSAVIWGNSVGFDYSSVDTDSSTSTTSTTTTIEPDEEFSFVGIFLGLIAGFVAGVMFALLWLQCIKMFAEHIIKILLFVSIGLWLVAAVVGVMIGEFELAIFALVVALFFCLYTWCIWGRIPFASACLSISSTIVTMYPGVIVCSIAASVITLVWFFMWVWSAVGYLASVDSSDDENAQPSNGVVFILLVCLYWGCNVWRNVSHTTTCGVAASWYFTSTTLQSPSKGAFRRTMTTSFGSICFGSLLVAILQAIRAFVRSMKSDSRLQCIALCLLGCIEWLMRYFNTYAFAQCAIYGTSFLTSAKATWDLFLNRGFQAIINDDLSNLPLTCGALLGFLVSGAVSFLILAAFYPITTDHGLQLCIYVALCAAILSYFVIVDILICVASGVVCIFVCFAEDPAVCRENRPEAFAKMTGRSPAIADMVNQMHM